MTAKVKHPNTPMSDRQTMVAHIVTMDDGTEVEVNATDPMQAMEKAQAQDRRYLGKYCCGHPTLCGCGGGWFYGVHITHGMLQQDPGLLHRLAAENQK